MSLHKELVVNLGERSYPIWIGKGLLSQISTYLEKLKIETKQKLLIVTDEHIKPLYAEGLRECLEELGYSTCLYSVPAGEKSKSMLQYENIMTYAITQKLDRKSVLLAVGGGVVGDLAGFVASTFMRGIPYIQIPTTIQAHDSSVGGKVAINHPLGKNLIGSFYQPLAVIYDTETLLSLPLREVTSGFAEVIKHGFIKDATFVDWMEKHRQQCLQLEEPYLSEALYRCCQIKADVVAEDEKENGLRAILNFGHTFGHAFEALGEYTLYTHGEAISIGMVLAARLSERIYGHVGLEERISTLLASYGVPITWSEREWTAERILEKMYNDKKVIAGSLNLVLLKEMGEAELVQNMEPDVVLQVIRGEG